MSQADRIANELEKFTERLMVKLTLDVSANLKEATPVDTGWARANWLSSAGKKPPNQPDMGNVGSMQAKQASSEATVASVYSLQLGNIYVSNGVPYINRLNAGDMSRPPSAFVEKSIMQAIIKQR